MPKNYNKISEEVKAKAKEDVKELAINIQQAMQIAQEVADELNKEEQDLLKMTDEICMKEVAEAVIEDNSPFKAVVNCGRLNVRLEPSQDSEVTHILKLSDCLEVKELRGLWAQIVTNSGVEGYVMEKFIKEV